MKEFGKLMVFLMSLMVLFAGKALASSDNSLSGQEIDNHTTISYDGEKEETHENYISLNNNEERISLSYEGSGEVSLNNYKVQIDQEEESDIDPIYGYFSIIGDDDRRRITNTKSFPYRAVVKLRVKYPNSDKTYGCTGFMVSKDTVVTAGHCIYNHDRGGWAKEVTAAPGRNGGSYPYEIYKGKKLYSVKGWTRNKKKEYDYGAIKLNGSPGTRTGWFGYRTTNAESPKGKTVNVTGYPCDKTSGTMWTDSGKILTVMERRLGYDADTAGCQSGSPVYRKYPNTGQTVIAIHGYAASGIPLTNKGTRITKGVFDNISKWKE